MLKEVSYKCLVVALLLLAGPKALPQQGNYFFRNFTPAQTGNAAEQNWGMTQDAHGRLFVANLNGIYLYDGKNWEQIQLYNNASCTSVERDDDFNIYAGGLNEFGIIKRKANGAFYYSSISQRLKLPEFGTIWKIICIDSKVYFCSTSAIFLLENGKITTINTPSSDFHSFNKVGNLILTRLVGRGLCFVDRDRIIEHNDTSTFKNLRIYGAVEEHKDQYILFTREAGVFHLNIDRKSPETSRLTKIKSALDNWMALQEIYCTQKIGDNRILLGSKKNGFKIIDDKFNVVYSMNENSGLLDDGVYNAFKDHSNNIWLALANGICYLECNTPITRWTNVNGVKGSVESVMDFKDDFYIATIKNLQRLNSTSGSFESIGIDFPCYDLAKTDQSLFVGTDKGVYSLNKGGFRLACATNDAAAYHLNILANSNIIFIGTESELLKGHIEANKIIIDHSFSNAPNVRTSVINKKGELLFGSATDGLFYLKDFNDTNILQIGIKEGLPSLFENKVFLYENEFVACTDSGFYKIEVAKDIHAYKDFKKFYLPGISFVECAIEIDGEIWFMHKFEDEKKKPISAMNTFIPGSKKTDNKQLHRLRDLTVKDFYKLNDIIYIAASNGLYAYDHRKSTPKASYSTLLSKVFNHSIEDTLLQNVDTDLMKSAKEIVLAYADNEITFEAAASDYIDKERLLFSWYLDGSDEKKFNSYSDNPIIHYGNLHEGTYILHIKARNVLGVDGQELTVKFRVLAPWYRTWWAYCMYGVLFVGSIWILILGYTKHLRQKNLQLEKVIQERTQTVIKQKAEIEIKNKEITDSINYAKLIQLSILPDMQEIRSAWDGLFVYYQPKDIVSGDFYWYSRLNEQEFLIACADCTGHGVPGGFMSMICSDKLHDSTRLSSNVDEILFHTNNGVKKTLRQGMSSVSNKDGMEIGLLKVNPGSKEVSFSSANRPLFIIRKDSGKVEEVKPTKASIASYTDYNFHYPAYNLKLSEGDTVYLTSDGYPDQFGGPDGKKYMSRNFKSLLLQIVHLPMEEQYKVLKQNMDKWMHGYEQVDDFLVIGLRL